MGLDARPGSPWRWPIDRASLDQSAFAGRAAGKKTFQLEISQPGFGSGEKKTFSPAQKMRDAPKNHLLWKTHEKPGDLGDLAKSTYNHLVTFDSRGT